MSQVVNLHPPVAPVTLPKDATWPLADVLALFELPLPELMFRAAGLERVSHRDLSGGIVAIHTGYKV